MSTLKYEYQVSQNAQSDRKYFSNCRDALAEASRLSMKQSTPVRVDVRNFFTDQDLPFWYTVTRGVVAKHGVFAKKGVVL